MKRYVVVSAVGPDRPGFVNRVTSVIHGLGGNIELQRSTRMAGEFALIVLFSLPGTQANAEAAAAKLAALQSGDMMVNARIAVAPADGKAAGSVSACLQASGADQPGIIDAVTLLLFKYHVTIESMDYDTESAPFTGESLFKMTATLSIPKGTDLEALQSQLKDLEQQMNFDVGWQLKESQ